MTLQAQTVLKALSTDPSLVTGGDVLVELQTTLTSVKVELNHRDVSNNFQQTKKGIFVGLVEGLRLGNNELRSGNATLLLINYPIQGPVFSGPRQKPFVCETQTFRLPDGSMLGSPTDENCSADKVIQYVYLPANSLDFRPLSDMAKLPADVATTTTLSGDTVNFIVRVETGTMDRGIYQNAILHDPFSEPALTPLNPPKGWNHRLVALEGSGCPGGWYVQGSALGTAILDRQRLAQGYALFSNTLNHSSNSCNAILAAEATTMGKEHFIETFGVPAWTISIGGSGGAYTSLQIADAFPGLFDGVMIRSTFPDALSIALAGLDAHLLMHYFQQAQPTSFSEAQQVAVGGYQSVNAMVDMANQAQRTDPVPNRQDLPNYKSAVWKEVVPDHLRYDPEKNPAGVRPTIFDVARNVYGVAPQTGFALRTFDNIGVQYGLEALNRGVISVEQFLDLNEKIGGVDDDSNYTVSRASGNADAILRAYESGLMLSGGGGLRSIPVVDDGTSKETGGYHYGWFHFALRERLRQANGDADNMVLWRNTTTAAASQNLLDHWISAWKSDKRPGTARQAVLRDKPVSAQDGCFLEGRFIPDELSFDNKDSECSKRYPVYSNTRHEAGGPLAANILKCQLKPVNYSDYQVPLTPTQQDHLKSVFPEGVCDFSRPGVNQHPLVLWPSFGPSRKNLVYEAAP
jgi:hypothetical protein